MGNRAAVLLSGLVLSLGLAGVSDAADIPAGPIARGGVFRCGGANFLRLGGTEIQFTAYGLRNLSSTTPIMVDRVTIYDSQGNALIDSRITGLPAFPSGVVLGPNNNVLGPNQYTELDTDVALPFLPPQQRSLQLELAWSAPSLVPVPDMVTARIARERDPSTGAHLADRARTNTTCRSITLRI